MITQQSCVAAMNFYENELSEKRNVVGLGVVPTHTGYAVAVYVSQREENHNIPETLQIGNVTVPVVVIDQGIVGKE